MFVEKISKGCLILISLLISASAFAQQQVQHLSPVKGDTLKWEKEYWSNKKHYKVEDSSSSKLQLLVIDADSMSFFRWYKKIPAHPFSRYQLSLKIKTIGIEGDGENSGAGISIGDIPVTSDSFFTGSHDWFDYSVTFETKRDDSFFVECLLGKNGLAKGKVLFSDIELKLIDSTPLNPHITIHLDNKKEEMSPYIYGQFIEHMGRSIYGGIWAEMLSDRKFYYEPGSKKSPWIKVGSDNLISLDSIDRYSSGNKVVLVTSKGGEQGIEQKGLGLLKDRDYVGRIVLKADHGVRQIKVKLAWGSSKDSCDEKILKISQRGYHTIPLAFHSKSDTNDGKLSFIPIGKGDVHLAAVSLMPDDNVEGFRKDVLELMKRLDAPIYRWPGGNFVSGYNWKDGIGDPDKRPTRFERAWNGLEYNDVGIHEFMTLCKLLNTEANVAVNTGLGTAQLAAEEVEYFNGKETTPMGKWRAQNGHPEPYNVKTWAVGNEMFGEWQLGHMPIDEYVKKHNAVAKAMWEKDPGIQLIAVGYPGHWNDMMYEHCNESMNYISEHFYKQDWHAGGLMTHVYQIPKTIKEIADEHRRCRREIPEIEGKNIKIALDEWNYWYGPHVYGLLGTRYFLRDALGIAAGLNEFSRQSDMFFMANYAQTVNVIGAIKTTKTGAFLEGTGQVLELYRKEFGAIPVEIAGFSAQLDIAATLTTDGKHLTVSVVNPTNEDVTLHLDLLGADVSKSAERFSLSGSDDMVCNDFDEQRIFVSKEFINDIEDAVTVPKISATIFKFEVQ